MAAEPQRGSFSFRVPPFVYTAPETRLMTVMRMGRRFTGCPKRDSSRSGAPRSAMGPKEAP